ncbi:MAG: hypothetical protein KAS96_08255 [Planctomycetes bacterium]|nr:hypothetical protein [Planctomycetota bacterium]
MRKIAVDIEDKISELMMVLDIDIAHLQESLLRLNDLRMLVVKRDNDKLGKLLMTIEASTNSHKENEQRRQRICQYLAEAAGTGSKYATLADIEQMIDGPMKLEFNRRRLKLKVLASEVKNDYLSASMLLADCARVNRMLLDGIFGGGKGREISYSANGSAKRENNINFMSMEL